MKTVRRLTPGLTALFILVWLGVCVQAQLAELNLDPLDLELGSRPLGLGGAFVGLADDVNTVLYNPAGLAWAKGISLSFGGINNLSALQAYPTGANSSFGLAVVSEDITGIAVSSGTASSRSNVICLAYGTKLNFLPGLYEDPQWQKLSLGLSLKGLAGETYKQTGSADRQATGWDLDLGLLWKGGDWWSAGATVQNILPAGVLGGGAMRWDTGFREGFPALGKLAAAAKIINDLNAPIFMEGRELVVGGELVIAPAKPGLWRLGGEWGLAKKFFLRAGLMQQYSSSGVAADLNFGLGYREEKFGLDFVSHREPISNSRVFYISALYFPPDWIIAKNLEMAQPTVAMAQPIEKISLDDNIVTYDESLDISGKVKLGVEVFINGMQAALDKESAFKVVMPLALEKNLIVVEARYQGEKKTWKYKVLRKGKVQVAEEKKIKQALTQAVTSAEKEKLQKAQATIVEQRQQVEALVTLGVVEVSPEAEFVMEAGVTRGELATWIVKGAEMPLPLVTVDLYPDVPKNHPLAPYIKVVGELRLFTLFPDGTFRPGAFVSKEEGEAIFAKFGVK